MEQTKLLLPNGYVDLFDRDSNGKPINGFWGGDASALKFSMSEETIDHKESYSGFNAKIAEDTVGQSAELEVVFHSVVPRNLALVLYGNVIDVAAGSVAAENLGAAAVGKVVALEHLNASDVVLTDSAGSPATLVLNTHYTLNAKNGRIEFLSTAGLTGDIKAAYDYADYSGVGLFTTLAPERYMRYSGMNKRDGAPFVAEFPRVRFRPASDIQLIGKEYVALTLKGSIMLDELLPASGPFGQFGRMKQG